MRRTQDWYDMHKFGPTSVAGRASVLGRDVHVELPIHVLGPVLRPVAAVRGRHSASAVRRTVHDCSRTAQWRIARCTLAGLTAR